MSSWRDDNQSTGKSSQSGSGWRSAGRSKPRGDRQWKDSITRPSSIGRRLKITGLFALFLTFVGVLIWLVLNKPRSVPVIALATSPYEFPVPPLAFVEEDTDLLKDVLGATHDNVALQVSEQRPRSGEDFLKELSYQLQSAKPGGPTKNVIVVHFRAHGVVHSSGQPCLLLAGAKPLDESTWLPLQRVFETALRNTEAASILFVLDAVAERTWWQAGDLHNQFASRLDEVVTSEASGRIFVLHAADKGQVSHSAPELRGSVFSHYVARGLQGEADSNGNDEVSLHELHQFVRDHANAFSRARRADSQHAVLFPRDRDLRISHVAKRNFPLPEPWKIPEPTVRLDELWTRYAALHRAQAYSADPLAWSELEHRLVRLEAVCLAGKAYTNQLDLKEITVLMDELASAVKIDAELASSLAVARWSVDDSTKQDARNQIAKWKASLTTDQPLPVPSFREPVASLVAWSEAVADSSPAGRQQASQILHAATAPRAVPYTEIKYLQLLGSVDSQGTTAIMLPPALACFQLAEEAAGPRDVRVHYWIRDLMNQSDRSHDQLLDNMLVGSPSAQQAVQQSLQALTGADGGYPNAKGLGELVAEAYQLRDEAWATLPHLAAWIDSEAWLDGAGVQLDGQVRARKFSPTLSNLIQATHQLADAIDRLPLDLRTTAQAQQFLEQPMGAVRVNLSALQREFDQKCSTLVQGETYKDDERTMRQIAAVLKLPLLPNGDVTARATLRNLLYEHRSSAYQENGDSAPNDVQNDQLYLAWLTDQPVPHVLAAVNRDYLDPQGEGILSGSPVDAVPNEATDLDRRSRLGKLSTEFRTRLADVGSAGLKMSASKREGPVFANRAGLSKADRLLRATAPILGERVWSKLDVDQDPIRRLRRFDQMAFHLWHGRRALQNWWGSDDARPYFAELTEHQLAATARYARLAPEGRPEIEHGARLHARLRSDLAEQEAVAARWTPTIQTEDISVTSDTVRHSVTTVPVPGLPSGQAAIYLSGDNGTLEVYDPEGQRFRRRASEVSENHTLFHVIRNARKLPTGSLSAHTLFRGHHHQVPFDVDDPGQAIVVWNELSPTSPKITVSGDSREKSQIMFVLDCSLSMSANYQGSMNRLQFAIETFKDTVRKLDRNHHVGLILYGHRHPDGPEPAAQLAATDVEVVSSIGEPNTAQFQKTLFQRLDSLQLKPTGATPLYLSIQKAIQSFDAATGGVKAVVVLTDGDNHAIVSPTARDVVESWKDSLDKPRIDIVAIAGQLNQVNDLTAITGVQADGEVHQNVTAKQLAKILEELVGLRTFHVVNLQTGYTSDELPLGHTWTEDQFTDWDLFSIRRNYRIQVGSTTKDVLLEGGEHLEVVYNRRGARLEFEPYVKDSDEDRIPVPGSDLYALSHYPWKDQNSLIFQVSIQSMDTSTFSKRPRHVWAELQPNRFGIDAPLIHAFDGDFKMGAPVPVFQFRVRNWPGSESAKMKLWFRYDESIPGEKTIEVQKDRETTQTLNRATLRFVPNRRDDGVTQLLIVEEHDDESTNFPLTIRMIPPAKKTEHRRFPRKREVHHLFECEDRNSLQVGISAKPHLARGWYETESFDVLIPKR